MKKKFLHSISLFAFIPLIFSCDAPDSQKMSPPVTDSHLVSMDVAQKIAMLQAPRTKGSIEKNGRINATKSVNSVFPINPDKDAPLMYVVNYEGGGFMIVSGDDRTLPVLAHSDTHPFPIEEKILPAGLLQWLANEEENIKNYGEPILNKTRG